MAKDLASTPDGVSSRPWYRLHLLTLLVAALFAGLLAYGNLHSINPYGETVSLSIAPPMGVNPNRVHVMPAGNFKVELAGFTRGWPFRYRDHYVRTTTFAPASKRPPVVEKSVLLDSPRALAADVLVALVVVLSVALLVERWLRSGRWFQFGLRGLLVAMAVAAVFLSAWQVHDKLETAFGQENLVTRVFQFPVYVYVPVVAGVICTIYTILWLAASLALGLIALTVKTAARGMTNVESQMTKE